jgi:hypothetical protein
LLNAAAKQLELIKKDVDTFNEASKRFNDTGVKYGQVMQKIAVETSKLSDSNNNLSATTAGLEKAVNAMTGNYSRTITKLIEAQTELGKTKDHIKTLDKQFQSHAITQDEYVARKRNLIAAETEQKLAISELTSRMKAQQKEVQAADGSMDQMAQKLGLLRDSYRKLSEAQRNLPLGQAMKAEIDKLDTSIKELDGSIGNFQRNVGNYPQGFVYSMQLAGVEGEEFKKVAKGLAIAQAAVNVTTQASNNLQKESFVRMKAQLLIEKVFHGLKRAQAAATVANTAATGAETVATNTATVATKGLDKAMNALPIMLIVAALAALVTGIIAAVKWFSRDSDEVTKAKKAHENYEKAVKDSERAVKAIDFKGKIGEYEIVTKCLNDYAAALRRGASEAELAAIKEKEAAELTANNVAALEAKREQALKSEELALADLAAQFAIVNRIVNDPSSWSSLPLARVKFAKIAESVSDVGLNAGNAVGVIEKFKDAVNGGYVKIKDTYKEVYDNLDNVVTNYVEAANQVVETNKLIEKENATNNNKDAEAEAARRKGSRRGSESGKGSARQ